MADVISIHVWKEGDAYRSSVQEDVPATFAFPEPFWSEYIKKKEIQPQHRAGFGEAIFRSVFNSLKRDDLARKVLAELKQSPLTLSIVSAEEIVHEIPWELMRLPGRGFLGELGNIAIVRTLPGHRTDGRRSSPPYRILVVLSLPVETYQNSPLDPLRELENLYRGVEALSRKGLVKIDVCVRATVPEIRAMLVKTRYDVLHFVGHGGPGGLLVLEDEKDFTKAHEMTSEEIDRLFGDLRVQAVILNACHTQSGSFFSPSLAMRIYRIGVPIVLANQSSVEDEDAIQTARAIYEGLFLGDVVSPLLNGARLKIAEWWKPVLFASPRLMGREIFLPPTRPLPEVKTERVFQDLGTLGTTRTYVYRYRPLREITHHLTADARVIVLHGIGGAGKSFMADYLARFLRQDFVHVLAIDVRRLKDATAQGIRERILDTFGSHEALGKEESGRLRATRAFPLFWKRLNQALGHVSWLLVLDNFEVFQDEWGVVKDEAVRDILKTLAGPDWAGRLIITSRLIPYLDSRLSLEPVVEIGTYDEAEKQFLFGQLGEKEKNLIAENQVFVQDDLGWHPLATDLFLKSGSPMPESILGQQDLRQVLDFYRAYLDTYGPAFARLFAMRHPMSREMLALVLGDADLLDLLSRRLRLLQVQGDHLRPYPILRLAFEKDCPLSDEALLGLAEVLVPFEPKGLGDDLNRLDVLEMAEAMPDVPEDKKRRFMEEIASGAERMGRYFYERGGIKNSILFFEKALAISKGLFGERHPDVARLYNNLGMAHSAKGALEEAIRYYHQALEISKGFYGENHPHAATSYNNLGAAYYAKGDMEEAIRYYHQALGILKGLYGENNAHVAASYNNLGGAYRARGDLDEAIRYYSQALKTWKEHFGEMHPDVATSYDNLGGAYREKGDMAEAVRYHHQALEVRKRLFGEMHPHVADSYNSLGVAYHVKGDRAEAIRYHLQAFEIRKFLYGENHPDVATSYNNLGMAYKARGEVEEAIRCYHQALEITKRLYGANHPQVATSYNNLGAAYCHKGNLDEAIHYHHQALEIWKRLFGENHPDVATSYNNLGGAYHEKGELDEAIRYHRQALEIWKGLFGENHPQVAASYNNLGGAYHEKGDLGEAIRYHRQALEIGKGLFGENHPQVAASYNNLGGAYHGKGDPEEAIRYYSQALKIWRTLGYRQDEARLCLVLAGLQKGAGRPGEAARMLCKGVSILEFLKSDKDKGFWLSQASKILDLAEGLKLELEKEEFYTCREMIRQYQDTLGPVRAFG